MKHINEIEIPARVEKRVTKVTCDLCGKEIKKRKFDVNDVQISHRTGSDFPEGGHGDVVSVDMCGKCFDEKLVPWLKEQGIKPNTSEWDW